MILGILLICISPTDATQCVPVPNSDKLYESIEACQLEANAVAESMANRFYVRTFCIETDFFELL
jgi:hypothetical protein